MDVIGDVKNLLQSEAMGKDLTMEVETKDLTHWDIYCDSLRLNQVLLNLVGNPVVPQIPFPFLLGLSPGG